MKEITDEYIDRFIEVASVLLERPPSREVVWDWYNFENNQLQDFFANNVKVQWLVGISTIEAVEYLIDEAVGNANVSVDWRIV